jgi:hypothetical protein
VICVLIAASQPPAPAWEELGLRRTIDRIHPTVHASVGEDDGALGYLFEGQSPAPAWKEPLDAWQTDPTTRARVGRNGAIWPATFKDDQSPAPAWEEHRTAQPRARTYPTVRARVGGTLVVGPSPLPVYQPPAPAWGRRHIHRLGTGGHPATPPAWGGLC